MNEQDDKRRRRKPPHSRRRRGNSETMRPPKIKLKDEHGTIKVERHMHDGAVVISGLVAVVTKHEDFDTIIAQKLESAARNIKESGGVVGHIKASASTAMVEVISVTDEDAMIKPSPERNFHINLTAIVFSIEPEKAEKIVKTALGDILTEGNAGNTSTFS